MTYTLSNKSIPNSFVNGQFNLSSKSTIVEDVVICFFGTHRGVARSKNVGWTHMTSAEREPIIGV